MPTTNSDNQPSTRNEQISASFESCYDRRTTVEISVRADAESLFKTKKDMSDLEFEGLELKYFSAQIVYPERQGH
jgi:hypothetical protein